MRKFKFFGIEFIIRLRKQKSGWSFNRLDQSYKVQLGRLVIYKMDKGTFNTMTSIVDNQGSVTIS
mgnify:FL=1|jgi:hypothetical protein|tara:strand:+ start:856 stop:1050 length:195 start_codon:yes stop_codon:yes gene_type:complete